MEVQFSAEQEAQLTQIAFERETDIQHLVQDAALRLIAEKDSFHAAVREGVDAADGGQFVSHDEVWANVEGILSDR